MTDDRRRGLSVRQAVVTAILLVVVSPVLFVLVTHLAETVMVDRTLERTVGVADAVADELGRSPESAALAKKSAEIAARHKHRVRVIAPDGTVTLLADELIGTSLLFQLGDFFYGPERASVLGSFDDERGRLGERALVKEALAKGSASECRPAPASLEVCDAAKRVDLASGRWVVHVQGSSRKALGALYDSRRQLAKLTLYVALLGGVLAFWMNRRVVAPMQRLQKDLADRAKHAVPTSDLSVIRSDEVGALTDSFNALLAALGNRRAEDERRLAELAHELKGPIASLRVYADRLRDGDVSLSPDEARELGKKLETSVEKLRVRVEAFLDLARTEAGFGEESRSEVNLNELLGALADVGRERHPDRSIELDLPDDFSVTAVPARIETVFANLLDNALHHAGPNGKVRIVGAKRVRAIEIAISDDGPGIPKTDLERVFDAFYSTREGGTGLGLAQSRAIVQGHAGSLVAESGEKSGTTLRVRLPRS